MWTGLYFSIYTIFDGHETNIILTKDSCVLDCDWLKELRKIQYIQDAQEYT